MGGKTISNICKPSPTPHPLPWAVVVHLENALAAGGAVVAAVWLDALAVDTPPHPALPGDRVHGQATSHIHQDTLLVHTLHRMD